MGELEMSNSRNVKKSDMDPLSDKVIGCAIEVHRELGPGLLENAYAECLCHELTLNGIPFRREVPMPVVNKGIKLDCGYRLDILAEPDLILELKVVEQLLPIHDAQLLTYLKLAGFERGLLLNFNVRRMKEGIRRLVLSGR
jgi:GxxExxY protein